MKRISLAIIILITIIGIAFWRTQVSSGPYLQQQCRVMMTTYVTVYAYGKKSVVSNAINHSFQRMQEVADKFNAHNPESPLYAFNQNGTPIKDEEILRVVKAALDISKQSGGVFDVTVYPLVKLWGFYGENLNQAPSQDKITEALTHIGYNHLILANGELKRDKEGIFIDLGGIAKGYVVGQGIEALKKAGVNSAIIQAGGDIYALGYKPVRQWFGSPYSQSHKPQGNGLASFGHSQSHKKGRPWKIGIRHPRKDSLLGYIEAADQAVMGSGDYERFFIKEGKRYNHIIDPRTGYPAKEVSAVTVIYSDPVVADAWGPALLILGPDGLKIVEKIPGMQAIMVTSAGKVLYTQGLKKTNTTLFPD